jgi:hypothetical protein
MKTLEKIYQKVIGKNGRIIQSIRNIAKVRAVKEHIRAQVVLADDRADAAAPVVSDETVIADAPVEATAE